MAGPVRGHITFDEKSMPLSARHSNHADAGSGPEVEFAGFAAKARDLIESTGDVAERRSHWNRLRPSLYAAGMAVGQEADVIALIMAAEAAALGQAACSGFAQQRAIDRGIPPVLLITLPKSGSMYILHKLCLGLDTPHIRLTEGAVSRTIVPGWLALLSLGGAIGQEHTDADPANLALLRAVGIRRVAVHVRDPRQSMISNMHHEFQRADSVDQRADDLAAREVDETRILANLDRYLDRYMPRTAAWLRDWMVVADRRDLDVVFTRFKDMKADPRALIEKILSHFGVDEIPFDWSVLDVPPKKGKLHFRRGETDEWRRLLSSDQQARAWAQIEGGLA